MSEAAVRERLSQVLRLHEAYFGTRPQSFIPQALVFSAEGPLIIVPLPVVPDIGGPAAMAAAGEAVASQGCRADVAFLSSVGHLGHGDRLWLVTMGGDADGHVLVVTQLLDIGEDGVLLLGVPADASPPLQSPEDLPSAGAFWDAYLAARG